MLFQENNPLQVVTLLPLHHIMLLLIIFLEQHGTECFISCIYADMGSKYNTYIIDLVFWTFVILIYMNILWHKILHECVHTHTWLDRRWSWTFIILTFPHPLPFPLLTAESLTPLILFFPFHSFPLVYPSLDLLAFAASCRAIENGEKFEKVMMSALFISFSPYCSRE